jgi:anthranilate phosphoribosyltransferase
MDIRKALALLIEGHSLSAADAEAVMEQIMTGQATPAQIGGLLTALRAKKETAEEITGFARAMRGNAVAVSSHRTPLVDVCGTGGDGSGTFNISTAAAFVIAGAGLAVAKHGNRSVSSKCGSADVLEALGVQLTLAPEVVGTCIDEVGIGFLYAPQLHPAMKHAIGPRREMGIRTVFNILGPLTNPAGARVQVLGVYDAALTEVMAQVLHALGCKAAFVVHGGGGLDELSTIGSNKMTQLRDGEIRTFTLDPQSLGLPQATLSDLRGDDAEANAAVIEDILTGTPGPRRDVVLLNAAACLVAGNTAPDLAVGLTLAAESIDSGAARATLDALIAFSKKRGSAA